jgi:hypothetical protein
MADFTVAYAQHKTESYSGDDASYDINPNSGVLTVFDGSGKRLRFSQPAWLCVEEAATENVFEKRGLTTV